VYGRPLILKLMTKFFDFSCEEMTRAPVWVRFPNLPLCCWSPPCLSKIASVLGKPIQSDHMTSSLSRLSYARVLVELDLREDLHHSVAMSLPSGPILNQKVVYEALPKFCNLCNVIGHTRLLCSKDAVGPSPVGTPSLVAGNRNVFHRLGPQLPPSGVSGPSQPQPVQGPSKDSSVAAPVELEQAPCDDASNGWIAVEPRRKSKKPISHSPKGKEVFAVAAVSALSPRSVVPSDCVRVVNSLGTEVVVDAGVDLGATFSMASPTLGDENLATTPIAASEPLSVCTGTIRTSSGANPLVANSCAEDARDPLPSYPVPLVLTSSAGEGHIPSPPNSLEITTGAVNMAGNPVMEVSAPSRVRNRNQKQSGHSQRTPRFTSWLLDPLSSPSLFTAG